MNVLVAHPDRYEAGRFHDLDHSIRVLRHKAEGDSADGTGKNAALSTEDYDKYLKKVYSAGDFKKPRDLVGLAKTQPPDEMKKLILANTPVTDQDLKNLADLIACFPAIG